MSAVVKRDVNEKKRRFLAIGTAAVGAGAAAAVGIPMLWSMWPSARAKAAGAPTEVDLSKVEPGMQLTVEWRGAPVWVLHRTDEMLAQLAKNDHLLADPQSNDSKQPEYAKNPHRSRNPQYLIVKGVCTHLGCSPTLRKEIGAADLGATGREAIFAPATNPSSISRRACSRVCRRREIWKSPPTRSPARC